MGGLNRLECLSRDELESLQLCRLREAVERCRRSSLYKDRLKGFSAENLKSLDAVRRLPFTTKKDLRDNYPLGALAVPRSQVSRFHASSGTGGKPTLAAYTTTDLQNWADIVARSLACAGVQPGDTIHNAYGYGLFTGGIGIHQGAESLGTTIIPAGGGKTHQQIVLLEDLRANVICCTPSYALNIAYAMKELGKAPENFNLKLGIFGAEPWSEPMRTQIEELLGIKAVDIYGMSELMGPGVAVECLESRCGLHIWEDHFLPEIIDSSSGEVLADGNEGELVVTTLTREAAPLLRFRTGDVTALSHELCGCGRTTARMTRVRARLDDMLIVRGINVYPSEIENILLQIDELAPHYQLILRREKALDELCVQVELKEHISASWTGQRDESVRLNELADRVRHSLKENLGLTAMVELAPVRSIARSEGKACRLLDLRTAG